MKSDYLKYWRVVRQFIKVKHNLTQADLDILLFLKSEQYFSKDKFKEFDELISDCRKIKGENSPIKRYNTIYSELQNNNYNSIENIIEKKILIEFNKYKNEEIGITLINNSNGPGVKN